MATGQVLEYEAGLDKWELGPGVPESLQGACGVSAGDRVILTGGKNDKECSYGSQSVWVLDGGEWMRGPDMSHARSLMIKTCFTGNLILVIRIKDDIYQLQVSSRLRHDGGR